jgi:cobalt/nickel transport system permease protein
MRHSFLDKESEIESAIRSLNPKTKVFTFIPIVILVVTTAATARSTFLLFAALALFLIMLSHIPINVFLRRLLVIIPFILMAVAAVPFAGGDLGGTSFSLGLSHIEVPRKGLLIVTNVCFKSTLSVLFLTLLISSTPFSDLISGLKELRVPPLLTDSLSFMYQYLFILIDEGERIARARDARLFGGRWIWHASIIGYMIGTLFVRSFERGEIIYLAMKARGYDSELIIQKTGKLGIRDFAFMSTVLVAAFSIRIFGTYL